MTATDLEMAILALATRGLQVGAETPAGQAIARVIGHLADQRTELLSH